MAERLAIHNAVRGCRRAQQYYEYKPGQKDDVFFDLTDIDKITVGQEFKVQVRNLISLLLEGSGLLGWGS